MDENLKWANEQRIYRTIESLKNNNMNGYLVNDKNELIQKLDELMAKNSSVSCGGSMTLFETGIIEYLRNGRYNFLDRYEEGLTRDQIKEIYRKSFSCDNYIVSSNAITEDGYIYNVDGNGNRVAAMLYGPDKVIIIAGVNKIVSNVEEAVLRTRRYAAPANGKRLNRDTPCRKIGQCMECTSSDRICNEYTLIKRQGNKDRIHVIFMNEDFGY